MSPVPEPASGHDTLEQIQNILGCRLGDRDRLIQALTHPSCRNERETGGDYQRLEFLGDAVLGMLLAEILYSRFPEADEGELSRFRAQLAGQGTLAVIARDKGLAPFIRLGRGEEQTGGRDKDSILSDVMESLLAAVYLDCGLTAARTLVLRMYEGQLSLTASGGAARDSKSELQEALSARGLPPPEYRLAGESGPPHHRQFRYRVLIEGAAVAEGEGRSKKAAQQEAAGRALQGLLHDGEAGS